MKNKIYKVSVTLPHSILSLLRHIFITQERNLYKRFVCSTRYTLRNGSFPILNFLSLLLTFRLTLCLLLNTNNVSILKIQKDTPNTIPFYLSLYTSLVILPFNFLLLSSRETWTLDDCPSPLVNLVSGTNDPLPRPLTGLTHHSNEFRLSSSQSSQV